MKANTPDNSLRETQELFLEIVTQSLANAFDCEVEEGLLKPRGERIALKLLLALSGGPDSTSLLLTLAKIQARHEMSAQCLKIFVEAAHVNYGLRGQESDKDGQFCLEICQSLHVPLRIKKATDFSSKYEGRVLSEELLRAFRYDFFLHEAKEDTFDSVLTAHTADDQSETVLFRLIRGTSLKGIAGIEPSRHLSGEVLLLRPMLSLSRESVIDFLQAENVSARTDQSNEQNIYSRNFIRNSILKPLGERFPGIRERINNFALNASRDNDYIEKQASELFVHFDKDQWVCSDLRKLHPAIQRRIIAIAMNSRKMDVTSDKVARVLTLLETDNPTRISLGDGWDVSGNGNHIQWLNCRLMEAQQINSAISSPLKIPGLTILLSIEKAVKTDLIESRGARIENFPQAQELEAIVDLSGLTDQLHRLEVRRREPGDFIQPFGRGEIVGLKKYLHTKKAALAEPILRQTLDKNYSVVHCLVIAIGSEVLWVPGVGISEKWRVSGRPTHRMTFVNLASSPSSVDHSIC